MAPGHQWAQLKLDMAYLAITDYYIFSSFQKTNTSQDLSTVITAHIFLSVVWIQTKQD